MFVSMDVTFRENETFYGESPDLTNVFPDLFNDDSSDGVLKTGGDERREDSGATSEEMIVGVIPGDDVGVIDEGQEVEQGEQQEESNDVVGWPKPNEEKEVQVYTRRKRIEDEQVQGQDTSPPRGDTETQEHADTQGSDLHTSDLYDGTLSCSHDDLNFPIAIRKQPRVTAGKLPSKLSPYDVSNYVSYASLGSQYKYFLASLDSAVPIPRDWHEAKQDPRWRQAMLEEMAALDKNNTWIVTSLPAGKKVVSCKWVFTIKQTPEGKVERYKARLVARGFSQTYGVDYDETFAPVAKMSTIRALISAAANNKWNLFQLDVKNAFLHGDLHEEVYMEIPPGFNGPETKGKVCRLKKSLYGLKQSPRAWFGRFCKEVCSLGFQQSNADHTLFFKHHQGKVVILVVYVDDIVITGNDDEGIQSLKKMLAKSFEVKDLGFLHFFLGIEVAYGTQGIHLSQRKYVLDLLAETGMLESKPAATPIEPNIRITATSGNLLIGEVSKIGGPINLSIPY